MQSQMDILDQSDIVSMIYQVLKCILSQSTGQTKRHLKIYTSDMSPNV